jgi:hypothetical protein
VSLLHRAGKVGMIHDGVLPLLLRQPRDVLRHGRCRLLARDFDPVREEFYRAIAGDVHVAVFGFLAVEAAETSGRAMADE